MTAWWRAKLGCIYCGVVVATATAIYVLWPSRIVVPDIFTGGINRFSVAFVLSFLPGLTWLTIMQSRRFPPEAVSVRRARLVVLELVTAYIPPILVMFVFFHVGLSTVQGAGRSMLLAISLCIIALEVVPSRFSFLLPVVYLVIAAVSGFSDGVPSDWALVLSRWDPERDWQVLVLVMAFAITLRGMRHLCPVQKLSRDPG